MAYHVEFWYRGVDGILYLRGKTFMHHMNMIYYLRDSTVIYKVTSISEIN